jgi:hypothetical protein
MNKIIVATVVAVSALAGAAQAGTAVSNLDFLQAARCRGLAASEGLGKLDTAGVDAFLKQETGSRDLAVRVSANNKIAGAQKEGDKAEGAKKEKLLAERSGACSAWLNSAATGAATNTSN